MNRTSDIGLVGKRAKGAAMEAHTGTIGIGTAGRTRPWRQRLAQLRAALRRRRIDRAARAHSLRVNGAGGRSIPGSEHTHLLRQRGF
jgi:hypothetical protein